MARRDRELEAIENDLVDAWRMLRCLPDRERGFLSSGSRSAWPEIVKDVQSDYADQEAVPRRRLSRSDMAMLDRVFALSGGRPALDAVRVRDRKLFALVMARKAGAMAGGFAWEDVWEALGGKAIGATTAALRSRYEDALKAVAGVLVAERAA
jgi:hypothetical protein